jgi:C4-dicarboxylate-specific signal transduction histidine kinase
MAWRNEMAELRKMQIAAQTATAIAHELNQPLLAIASYSEAALTLLKDGKPEMNTIIKAINGCERQAHRAGNTIHELLDFLSLKEVPAESFDLNKTISDVVNTARLEHELQFDFALSLEDRLPLVFANRFHIEKVLFNLLRNGIEAMHEAAVPQPAITVTVCTKIGANVAQVTIQDNGPGIKEEHLHLLFKPFFTTKPKGIGMGLAVSRSLIEANGGQLWIDPAEEAGATFHLTLPFAS